MRHKAMYSTLREYKGACWWHEQLSKTGFGGAILGDDRLDARKNHKKEQYHGNVKHHVTHLTMPEPSSMLTIVPSSIERIIFIAFGHNQTQRNISRKQIIFLFTAPPKSSTAIPAAATQPTRPLRIMVLRHRARLTRLVRKAGVLCQFTT
eukprot:74244-Pelagomonas_calceolata.AAC.7